MKALSERVIKGAGHDSSLRDPPPQCHPGTRVQLREKIIAWFRNREREKALLWLNGPAGVGKSAVIQTVAESFAESKSLGATLTSQGSMVAMTLSASLSLLPTNSLQGSPPTERISRNELFLTRSYWRRGCKNNFESS